MVEEKAGVKFRNPVPPLPPMEGPAWREYFLLGLTLLAVYFACSQPLWDPDSFWHLAVGREIWTTHHLVRADTFSFTAFGMPWADTEWLFHLFGYGLWKLFGYSGLTIFTALMGSACVYLIYRIFRLLGGTAPAFSLYVVLLLPVYQSRVRFRPDLVSMLFMAILIEALLRWKPEPPRVGRLWIFLVFLFFVWAQFHAGWSYGLVLLGVFLLGELLDSFREKTFGFKYMLRLGLTGAAPIPALFLNPYGWKIPYFPVKSLIGFRNPNMIQIIEWNRTPFEWPYSLLIAAGGCFLVMLLISWRELTWKRLLWFASQVFLSLYWIRYVAYGVLGLSPFGAELSRKFPAGANVRKAAWVIALCTATGASCFYFAGHPRELNLRSRYPVLEVSFINRERISGNILNSYVSGGYLDWYAPSAKVFMDGRYYPFSGVLKDYRDSLKTVDGFERFLHRYPFEIAVYPYQSFKLKGKNAVEGSPRRDPGVVLFPRKDWALVYFGDYGEVLVKREKKYSSLIQEREYRLLSPDDLRYLVWATRRGLVDGRLLKREIERSLRETPWLTRGSALRKALLKLDQNDER